MAFPPTHLIDLNELAPGEEEEEIREKAEEPVELQLGRRRPDIEEEEEEGKTRLRFVPLCDVYSATSPYVSSIGGSSKKVKPPNLHHHRQPVSDFDCCDSSAKTGDRFLSSSAAVMDSSDKVSVRSDSDDGSVKMAITNVYVRRNKVGGRVSYKKPRFEREKKGVLGLDLEDWKGNESEESRTEEEEDGELVGSSRKRKRPGGSEPEDSGLNSPGYSNSASLQFRGPRKSNVLSRDSRDNKNVVTDLEDIESGKKKKRKHQGDSEDGVKNVGPFRMKKWTWLKIDGADPNKFVGLRCKVFWPLDADWYSGQVFAYDSKTGRHHIKYKDGEEENVIISNEEIKFHTSPEEMQSLKLSAKSFNVDGIDVNELVALAASLDDCDELEPANIIWAKLTGHAMWPALILDDSIVGEHKGLNKNMGDKSVLVQFFGTHDFARIKRNQVMSFLKGLISSFHLKCKKEIFARSLDEARMYLSEQKLPKRMSRLRNGLQAGDCNGESGEDEGSAGLENDAINTEEIQRRIEALKSFPFEIGDLQLISLGTVVKDSDNFQDERSIWPDGYTALRKFPSIADPNLLETYRMEVSRDNCLRTRPHFKVTSENGEQFSGSTPAACWSKIYRKMRKIEPEGLKAVVPEKIFESGAEMFGFTHPEISKLIKELATSMSRHPSKGCKMSRARCQDVPVGYRPVDVKWKDLDKCHVCHMDEEYENNLFLQCDKCRIMVHARCYGELEAADGALWLCNLCRPGAPEQPPRCCLCPVTGGAMKPTTDGRWAHLACAIWIPETCLSDIKKMEPIDGLSRVNKDRWKLLCRICGVSYGACIQCSNHSCRVAYHPLCARAAGFCVELEEEDRQYLIAPDEDEDDLCIRLLSFCKRHRPVSKDRCTAEDRTSQKLNFLDYSPPINPSGCARTEPYNYFGRRGRKEPEALAAASLKQLYVENRPHIVGGFCRHESLYDSSITLPGSKFSVDSLNLKLKTCQQDASGGILSVAEKYRYMKETVKKRLAFGKSGIHGFGIFAKHSHRAGDMMIEYVGELVRPSIADRREHMIYNSMVGAGTYMFRVDDRRVIDATRAGSIAHLINHSCDPNCYSRMITVNGDEHIIIFSKRDIKQWEELTYDYRFYAIDEQLACYCGVPGCRGVVNDPEAKEPAGKLYAPCSELIDWKGE